MSSFDVPCEKFEYSCATVELFVLTPLKAFEPRRNPVFWFAGFVWKA
jgi:hypothetical protein